MEDLGQMLADVSASMKALVEREAKGEDVSHEKAAVLEQKNALEGKSSNESELDRLRREKAEREERDQAEKFVGAAMQKMAEEEKGRQDRIERYTHEALMKHLSGGGFDSAVRSILSDTRTPSRFATEHADTDTVAELAAGGGVARKSTPEVKMGANREADKIRESKSVAHYMSIIARMKSGGFVTEGERIFLHDANRKSALAEMTNTAGGFLIHPEWMPDILGLLRNQTVVRRSAPRIVPFSTTMNQTVISSGSTAYYTAENARIPTSDMAFAEVPLLSPHNLTALVPVSNYLLNDAPAAEPIVRADMAEVMALREDLAFLYGPGTGGEPLGLKNLTGVTSNPLTVPTNGIASINLVNMRQIRNVTRTFNAQNARWVWFFNPALVSHLETLTDSFGRFLADTSILTYSDGNGSGTLDGVPFYTTNAIPANVTTGTSTNTTSLMLVNMNETIIGASQDLVLDVSSEASYTSDGGTTWISTFQNNQTLFRTIMRHDINHRRPNQIIIQTGVVVP